MHFEIQTAEPVESVRRQPQRIHVDCIHSVAGMDAIAAEWHDLFGRSIRNNIFLSHPWMCTWWKHFGRDAKLMILSARNQDGVLVGLAPMYISNASQGGLSFRRLGFLADSHVGSDHLDLLVDPEYRETIPVAFAKRILAMRDQWSLIELTDMAETPTMICLLNELAQAGMVAHKEIKSTCYHIPLPETFDAYLASVSGQLRRDFNRRWRVLEAHGGIDQVIVSDPASVQAHFPDLMRLHSLRFESQNRSSAILEPGVPEFHRDAVKAVAAKGWVQLSLLRAEGKAIAALYGFCSGDTFQYYQSGLDPEWYTFGLGKVMMGKAIQLSIRKGCTDFDLLRGLEEYKTLWAREARHTYTVQLFDDRFASQMARNMYRGRSMARQAKKLWESLDFRRIAATPSAQPANDTTAKKQVSAGVADSVAADGSQPVKKQKQKQ